MFAIAEDAVTAELTDVLDELSTRLIIDGVSSLSAGDFEILGQSATGLGASGVAREALRVARVMAGDEFTSSIPEMTRLLSSGLVEMRRLLDSGERSEVRLDSVVLATSEVLTSPDSKELEMNSLAGDEELVGEFVTESREHLVTIEGQMLQLEKDSSSSEALNAVFRAFHTIKGLAGFLEFSSIQSLAHEVETLLDLARNAELVMTPGVVDMVLECTDVMQHEIASIELRLAGQTPPGSKVDEELLERVRVVASGREPKSLNPPVPSAAVISAKADKRVAEVVPHSDSASVRIDTSKLDQLMDMVGEMVIAQTLIGHNPSLASIKDARFLRDLNQLARITADVQRISTGMRMVPIGMQFQKTARVIRDLSRRAGKQIVLETSGEDTELDKNIAEELSDPLLHMVRNSIDHGIESSEERVALGKDITARIRISAYHQSGQIVVAISDDGRGLNKEKIYAKAVQNGLIQSGVQLTDNEIFLLIFEAGFSTAEKVTDISGRGVGMDVVRRHVQKMRGRIDIQSTAGVGTTFFLKLPLTLAIIEGLVVVVGEHRYIAPVFSVKEMFRPTPEMISTVQGKREMAMVRGNLLPIVRLHEKFAIEPRTTMMTQGTLIVAESEGHQFCLFVDDLIGKQEVVIKGLGQSFKHVVGIAGCAILGDGRVGLILDIEGIYKGRS